MRKRQIRRMARKGNKETKKKETRESDKGQEKNV